jgi:hypothetical protein
MLNRGECLDYQRQSTVTVTFGLNYQLPLYTLIHHGYDKEG